jgi:histidine triad (HIT) family protein
MCIFCDIIAGKIPSHKIYEDEHTYAFLDIFPGFVGHTLVIPKHHCENIHDAPTQVLNATMATVQKLCNHYKDNCGYDGFNIFQNNGRAADQTVFHLHFHIVPQRDSNPILLRQLPAKIQRNFEEERGVFALTSEST